MSEAKIVEFIQQTFQSSQKKVAVIALSGGIDSATSLFLVSKAIGAQNVFAYYLPSKTSNPIHQEHAQHAAQAAELPKENLSIIPISTIVQKSWRIINRHRPTKTSHATNRLRLANVAARIRMLVIYDQAKVHNALVVGTENLSENILGYYTRFGDEASDLEPIRHLLKTQVIELAKSLGVPQPIIDKKPSADLWKDQTDAGELGFTYAEADPILELIHHGKTQQEILTAGHSEKLVNNILSIVEKNKFKQRVPYSL